MDAERMGRREWFFVGLALAGFVAITAYQLSLVPQPWWDEGWTLSVARNWVQHGHFGHYLLGQPASPALSAHLPVVALVAAGFELLGVGLVQARIVFVLCSAVTLLLLYLLTRALFSRRTAIVALLLVCFSPIQWDLSLILMGRQVLGEVPAVMFLFAAVLSLQRSGGRRWWLLGGSAILFGLALATKSQVVPFTIVALAAVSLFLIWRDRSLALRLGGVLGTAVLVMYGLGWLRSVALLTPGVRPDSVKGLTEVTALVLDGDVRIAVFRFAAVSALPLSLAIILAAGQLLRMAREDKGIVWKDAVKGVLLLLGGSWYVWYVFLSIGWGRYALPPLVLASPFLAAFILHLVDRVRGVAPGRDAIRPGVWSRTAAAGLLTLFILAAGRQVFMGLRDFPLSVVDSGLQQTAEYLNRETAKGSTIETYESELLFLLERPVHFPPPQLNVDSIRKNWLDPAWDFPYDLSTVTSDYIVAGAFGGELYEPLVTAGVYHPFKRIGIYSLYIRSRNGL